MERRTKPRFRMDLACRLHKGDREVRGQLLDVADGGLAIKINGMAAQGDVFRVAITRPGAPRVEVEALVWHTRSVRHASGRASQIIGLVISASSPEYESMIAERAGFAEPLATPLRSAPRQPRPGEAPRIRRPLAPPDPEYVTRMAEELESSALQEPEPGKQQDEKPDEEPTALPIYRVRMGMGPRTRSLCIGARDEDEARQAALESFGAEWALLEVSRR